MVNISGVHMLEWYSFGTAAAYSTINVQDVESILDKC